eukprot:11468332-Ditylum_brightwellii.AAC.1
MRLSNFFPHTITRPITDYLLRPTSVTARKAQRNRKSRRQRDLDQDSDDSTGEDTSTTTYESSRTGVLGVSPESEISAASIHSNK